MPPVPPPEGVLHNQKLIDWILEHDVQAILCTQQHILPFIEEHGIDVPRQLGYCSVDLSGDNQRYSGVNQNSLEIGMGAVKFISNLVNNNQKGFSRLEHVHLVRGYWQDGETLRQQ